MSEMALTASRKARLQVMVEAGDSGAQAAMDLHDNPTKFLSTVQIGITSIGILNGIVGDAAFSAPLAHWLHAHASRIGDRAAEITATGAGGRHHHLPHASSSASWCPSASARCTPRRSRAWWRGRWSGCRIVDAAVRAAAVVVHRGDAARCSASAAAPTAASPRRRSPPASRRALDAGVIEAQEHQMVRNVFRLDDRQVGSMMIPRAEIVWLDADAPPDEVLRVDRRRTSTRATRCAAAASTTCSASSRAQTLLQRSIAGRAARRSTEDLQPPVFVPETLSGMELLEHFRASSAQLVFVVDEYGEVQGMITVRDVLEAITGEFSTAGRRRLLGGAARRRQLAVRRPDPDARAEGPARPEGAARGGPRPLQHAGRHDHAAARPPAATRPTRSSGKAGASRSSTSTASASTRCSPARSRAEPVSHDERRRRDATARR